MQIDEVDDEGWSGLIHACVLGKFQSALILIENGAELDLKDDEGCTALHHAARQFDYYSVSEIQYSEISLDGKSVSSWIFFKFLMADEPF